MWLVRQAALMRVTTAMEMVKVANNGQKLATRKPAMVVAMKKLTTRPLMMIRL